jgi:hypothetical protein
MPSDSDHIPGTAQGASAGHLGPDRPVFSGSQSAPEPRHSVLAVGLPHPDRLVPVGHPGDRPMPSPAPDRWLTEYVAGQLREAGVVDDTASTVARRMSIDIAAAFATLHRVDAALDRAGVDLDS